jgi:hypothetical protein
MLAYFGGVPRALVPDQLKSGVTKACRYEPGIQRTYEEMALHYGTTVLPARPARPRDKAKVEVGVQVVERWILARLRNETFFSLEALNERIAEVIEDINARRMRRYDASRRELFERIDKPALAALPAEAFTYADWKIAHLNIDYHVEVARSTTTSTRLRMRSCTSSSTCASAPPRWSCSTRISTSPRTPGASCAGATPPSQRTCPRRIRSTSSGRRRASFNGPAPLDRASKGADGASALAGCDAGTTSGVIGAQTESQIAPPRASAARSSDKGERM